MAGFGIIAIAAARENIRWTAREKQRKHEEELRLAKEKRLQEIEVVSRRRMNVVMCELTLTSVEKWNQKIQLENEKRAEEKRVKTENEKRDCCNFVLDLR